MDTLIIFPILQMFQGLYTLFTGEPQVAIARIALMLVGIAFVYLSYKEVFEPVVLLPMGMGMIGVNGGVLALEAGQHGNLFAAPLATGTENLMNVLQIDFLQPIYTFTFSNGLIAACAMGPNVAGVITTAIIGGIYTSTIGFLGG